MFNILDHPIALADPRRLHVTSAWNEHVPFGMLIVDLVRPRAVVELGTQWGVSFCAFCQAVEALKLAARCSAIDLWTGDAHSGSYGPDVLADLSDHRAKHYSQFSELIQLRFEEAVRRFEDGSVDLLHIDGLHSYDAVKSDFETWLPKMSARGVILFHDTVEVDRGFGVKQLWSEVSRGRPCFEFLHGHGLGVLAVGRGMPPGLATFLEAAAHDPDSVRKLFSSLGRRLQLEVESANSSRRQANTPLWRRALRKVRATTRAIGHRARAVG
jgi:hypothetical protein